MCDECAKLDKKIDHYRTLMARVTDQLHYRAAPYNNYNEPYFGASQGYAPGEKQRFLDSVRRND